MMKRLCMVLGSLCCLVLTACSGMKMGLNEDVKNLSHPQMSPQKDFYGIIRQVKVVDDTLRLKVSPAQGSEITLEDPLLAGIILSIIQDPAQKLQKQTDCTYRNRVTIMDTSGKELAKIKVASDGCAYMQNEEKEVFLLPEFTYDSLQYDLLATHASLNEEPFLWEPGKGNAPLELILPELLRTVLAPAYGDDDARFVTCRIYPFKQDGNTIKLTMLVCHAGYRFTETSLKYRYVMFTPALLTLQQDRSGAWHMTRYKEFYKADEGIRTTIRNTQPFDVIDAMIKDLGEEDTMKRDMHLQAINWLQRHDKANLMVEDEWHE